MSHFPTKTELSELQSFKEPFCLTIYAPFLDPNAATNPNRIEFKNLLKEAEQALLSAGADTRTVAKTLQPARSLLENHEFWPIHHQSLVLFVHPKLFHYYHIPDRNVPYMLTVEKGFNTEPMVAIMKGNKQFFLLVLGHKNVRLYTGDRYQLKPVHLDDFPTDMKQALQIDEFPKWRETHEIAPSYMGKGSEATHGQYNVNQTDKDMLLEFFRRIDRRLHDFLLDRPWPLIIAGVQYLLPIYRKANTYPHLLRDGITGNHDNTDLQALQQKAWPLVERSLA